MTTTKTTTRHKRITCTVHATLKHCYMDLAMENVPRTTASSSSSGWLEIGCGPATLTLPLAQRCPLHGVAVVTAIDPGVGMLQQARDVLQQAGVLERVDLQLTTSLKKNFAVPSLPFDVIFAASSLHWVLAEQQHNDDNVANEASPPAMIQKLHRLFETPCRNTRNDSHNAS